jgi:hypothetical protein
VVDHVESFSPVADAVVVDADVALAQTAMELRTATMTEAKTLGLLPLFEDDRGIAIIQLPYQKS